MFGRRHHPHCGALDPLAAAGLTTPAERIAAAMIASGGQPLDPGVALAAATDPAVALAAATNPAVGLAAATDPSLPLKTLSDLVGPGDWWQGVALSPAGAGRGTRSSRASVTTCGTTPIGTS